MYSQNLWFSSTFLPSGQYRYTRGPNRAGRPRLHWAESVMSEASNQISPSNQISHLASDQAPLRSDIDNSFFQTPKASHVRLTHVSPSLMWMDNATLYRRIQPRALNRREWIKIAQKLRAAAAADGLRRAKKILAALVIARPGAGMSA